MERIFKEHYKRNVESLNGEWKFLPDKNGKGKLEQWYKDFPKDFRYVNVPSCWNLELDLFNYFGVCWYSKDFYSNECYLSVEFGAVSGLCEVYLDGELLGEHYGGWTAFSFEKSIKSGLHTLTVMVDASSNTVNTIPLQVVDWYHYGGIIRSVEISRFSAPYITNHKIKYELDKALKNASTEFSATIVNPFDKAFEIPINVMFNNTMICQEKIHIKPFEKYNFSKTVNFDDVILWDLGKPYLYDVIFVTDSDDIIEKIGFRKIEVRGKEIYLNGKKLVFKGVNRHEEHPDWGFAVPANITRRDVELIKDLNCNIIRGSHYPQSRTLLDYLDREGILFWSEIPMWGYPAKALGDSLTLERGLTMHSEMIEQYYHHPSIVIWGLHNEIHTETNEAYDLTKTFFTFVKSKDPSRLITFATNNFEENICLEFTDFVALNYYMGWYSGTLDDWEGFIKGIRSQMIEKGVGDKPVVMSEFGCAAIFGYDDFGHDKWTMQYQSDFIEKVVRLSFAEDGFCGTFVWQFADIVSDMEINRARGFNNKGVLNEHRRPKTSYFTLQKLYKEY